MLSSFFLENKEERGKYFFVSFVFSVNCFLVSFSSIASWSFSCRISLLVLVINSNSLFFFLSCCSSSFFSLVVPSNSIFKSSIISSYLQVVSNELFQTIVPGFCDRRKSSMRFWFSSLTFISSFFSLLVFNNFPLISSIIASFSKFFSFSKSARIWGKLSIWSLRFLMASANFSFLSRRAFPTLAASSLSFSASFNRSSNSFILAINSSFSSVNFLESSW